MNESRPMTMAMTKKSKIKSMHFMSVKFLTVQLGPASHTFQPTINDRRAVNIFDILMYVRCWALARKKNHTNKSTNDMVLMEVDLLVERLLLPWIDMHIVIFWNIYTFFASHMSNIIDIWRIQQWDAVSHMDFSSFFLCFLWFSAMDDLVHESTHVAIYHDLRLGKKYARPREFWLLAKFGAEISVIQSSHKFSFDFYSAKSNEAQSVYNFHRKESQSSYRWKIMIELWVAAVILGEPIIQCSSKNFPWMCNWSKWIVVFLVEEGNNKNCAWG